MWESSENQWQVWKSIVYFTISCVMWFPIVWSEAPLGQCKNPLWGNISYWDVRIQYVMWEPIVWCENPLCDVRTHVSCENLLCDVDRNPMCDVRTHCVMWESSENQWLVWKSIVYFTISCVMWFPIVWSAAPLEQCKNPLCGVISHSEMWASSMWCENPLSDVNIPCVMWESMCHMIIHCVMRELIVRREKPLGDVRIHCLMRKYPIWCENSLCDVAIHCLIWKFHVWCVIPPCTGKILYSKWWAHLCFCT
jgi:hypothetical protein